MTARLTLWTLPVAALLGAALLSGCGERAEAGPAASTNQVAGNEVLPAEPIHGAQPSRTYLVSIAGIALRPNEYVDGFSIDTWGVDFLAVCHLPPGWQIRAGRSAAPDGVLAGEASHGVTFLDQARLPELRGLALVRLYPPVQPRAICLLPATFAGHASIGTYGVDGGLPRRQAGLDAANIRLVPATRCPPPSG